MCGLRLTFCLLRAQHYDGDVGEVLLLCRVCNSELEDVSPHLEVGNFYLIFFMLLRMQKKGLCRRKVLPRKECLKLCKVHVSCIREKVTWMETFKQMFGMKNVSVLDNPPKPMDRYPTGIERERVP